MPLLVQAWCVWVTVVACFLLSAAACHDRVCRADSASMASCHELPMQAKAIERQKHTGLTTPNAACQACIASRWLLEGLWHGIVCFFVPLLALGESRRNGTVDGVFSYGVATYTALIIITNLKVNKIMLGL